MRNPTISLPPWWRTIAAFALTPLIAAFGVACIGPGYGGYSKFPESILRTTYEFALFGGYPPTIVLGVPAFLFLRHRVRASVLNCAATGAVVASLPWFVLGLGSHPDYAATNGHVTNMNGAMTGWGWIYLIELCGAMALLGAFSGALFWVIAAAGARR